MEAAHYNYACPPTNTANHFVYINVNDSLAVVHMISKRVQQANIQQVQDRNLGVNVILCMCLSLRHAALI